MKTLSFTTLLVIIAIANIANASTPTKKFSGVEDEELKFHHDNDDVDHELDDWINEEVYSKRSVQNHQQDAQNENKESSLSWSLWDKLSRIALSLCKQIPT